MKANERFGSYLISDKLTKNAVWNIAVLVLSSAVIAVLSLALSIGSSPIDYFIGFFTRPLLFLLNYFPVLLLQTLLFCIFNSQFPAFLITSLIIITASIGDYFKIILRLEPFLFSDFNQINAGIEVVGNYSLVPNFRIIASVVISLLGIAFVFFFARIKLNAKTRIISLLLAVFSIWPMWRYVYSSEHIYEYKTDNIPEYDIDNLYFTPLKQISKGFVYSFIHSISYALNTAPPNYSSADSAAALNAYYDCEIPSDRRVNILAVQLESFNDFSRLGIPGAEDAYSLYHSLEEESYTGNMTVNVYGGGTIDTERSVMTGNYSVGNVTKDFPSHIWYMDSQGYLTTGSHPNRADFYNRVNVNARLGFEEYYFSDHYAPLVAGLENTWQCDSVFFPEVLRLFMQAVDSGENVFSFNISLQTHSPYADDKYNYDTRYLSGNEYSDTTLHAFNNYLGSVVDTQTHIVSMVNTLRTYDKPAVLLLYGDHNPMLGDNTVYNELGLVTTPTSEKEFYDCYSTPYLIWANDAAKELTGNAFIGKGPTVSACYLMNVLFDQIGWEGSKYMQYNDELMKTMPIISSRNYYMADGKFTTELDVKGQELLNEIQCVQYYMSNDFSPY